eukprot:Phypoly_transcript_14529.p1 GENE.Phypoly_transcript_14529~~Phypoly_transcript_14529.p1  ORF type:complete len:218 (+),score=6.73 Phypoly_transcript_14529:333-986(+)
MQQSATMLGLLLSYTLYVSIVKKIDMEESRVYYFVYLAFFWIPTVLVPCLCFFEATLVPGQEICDFKSKTATIIRTCNFFFFLFIQVFLLFKVFKVVNIITGAVQRNSINNVSKYSGYFWLFARCVGAQISQLIVWLPTTIKEFIGLWGVQLAPNFAAICGVALVFLSLNGFIVLAGNKPLRSFLDSLFNSWCHKAPRNAKELLRMSSFSRQVVNYV